MRNLSVAATDSISGHATLSYSATTPLPPGLSINSSTGAITGRLTEGGDWETVITVTDRTYSNTDDFDWTVNSPITITNQGDQTNGIGDAVSVQISATDTACGTQIYRTGLPPGLSINGSTGLITGKVDSSASTTTPYTAIITVNACTCCDTAVDNFNWAITNLAPVDIFNPGNQANTASDQVAWPLQTIDTNGGTVLYSATHFHPVYTSMASPASSSALSPAPRPTAPTRQRSMPPTAGIFRRSASTGLLMPHLPDIDQSRRPDDYGKCQR